MGELWLMLVVERCILSGSRNKHEGLSCRHLCARGHSVAVLVHAICIIARSIEVPRSQQALCVGMCVTGSVLMMVADCHKYFALKYNHELAKQKMYLIDDGVFANNRNPNYLGEMLLYGSFVLMTGPRLEAVLLISSIWVVLFGTNMKKKDMSLQKKPGWEAY